MEWHSAKKKEILPCVTKWKTLKDIMRGEISPAQKDRYRMSIIICGISSSLLNLFQLGSFPHNFTKTVTVKVISAPMLLNHTDNSQNP